MTIWRGGVLELKKQEVAMLANAVAKKAARQRWLRTSRGSTHRVFTTAAPVKKPGSITNDVWEYQLAYTRPNVEKNIRAFAVVIDRETHDAAGRRNLREWNEYLAHDGTTLLRSDIMPDGSIRVRVQRNAAAGACAARIVEELNKAGFITELKPEVLDSDNETR